MTAHALNNDTQGQEAVVRSSESNSETSSFVMPTLIPQCEKDEYLVKTIEWRNKKVRIITQNENGPCPLVAICNVLFLRGDLDIQPPDRELVTFEYLVDRLGDYLLTRAPGANEANIATTAKLKAQSKEAKRPSERPERQETSESVLNYRQHLDSALIILPNLKSGLDVNVIFDSIRGFEVTAELSMFDLFNIDLVHGWIVDPQDKETYETIQKHGATYNKAVEFIVQLDDDTVQPKSSTDDRDEGLMLTTTEEEKLHEGFIIKEFLKDTATQLTYYGLELLLDTIPKDCLCVLFRNNHFSTLYRHPDLGLYMLVTDSGLALESSVIWESLSDIDQGSSEFLDGFFNKPVTTMTSDTQQYNLMEGQDSLNTDLDYAIAVSLQESEQLNQSRSNASNNQHRNSIQSNSNHSNNKQHEQQSGTKSHIKKSSQKKNNCVIC